MTRNVRERLLTENEGEYNDVETSEAQFIKIVRDFSSLRRLCIGPFTHFKSHELQNHLLRYLNFRNRLFATNVLGMLYAGRAGEIPGLVEWRLHLGT